MLYSLISMIGIPPHLNHLILFRLLVLFAVLSAPNNFPFGGLIVRVRQDSAVYRSSGHLDPLERPREVHEIVNVVHDGLVKTRKCVIPELRLGDIICSLLLESNQLCKLTNQYVTRYPIFRKM